MKYTQASKCYEYVCRTRDPQENGSGTPFKETEHFADKYPAAARFRKDNIFKTASPLVTISLKTLKLLVIIGLAELSSFQYYNLHNKTSFLGFSGSM